MGWDAYNDLSDSESSNNSSDSEPSDYLSDFESFASSNSSVQVESSINIDEPTVSPNSSALVESLINIDGDEVQYLSIQWLSLNRVFFRLDIEDETLDNIGFLKIINLIIKRHNAIIKKSGKRKVGFKLDGSDKRKLDGKVYKKLDGSDDRNLDGSDDENVFSLVWYVHTKKDISSLSKTLKSTPRRRRNFDYIIFIYQEKTQRFVALTTGNAWNVVRPYVDFNFPIKVSERIADIKKMIKLKRRCLFGGNLQEEVLNPTQNLCYLMSNLYYFIDSFKCDVKTNSGFFKLINELNQDIKNQRKQKKFEEKEHLKEMQKLEEINKLEGMEESEKIKKLEEMKKLEEKEKIKKPTKPKSQVEILKRCWIEVRTTGIIRIGKRLRVNDYLPILDEFAKYLTDTNAADADFKFLTFLRPVKFPRVKLDESLIERIYNHGMKISDLHVRHKYLEDFLLSNSFEIRMNSKNLKFPNPPTLKEIVEEIYNVPGTKTDFQAFAKIFKECKLTFIDQATGKPSTPELLIDCIEGEHRCGEIMYFKIRKVWYELTPDYLTLLYEDLKNVIINSLMAEDSPGYLKQTWTNSMTEEKHYNQSYAGVDGFLVFDTITPSGIECCDILKYKPNNPNEPLYLYQVKLNVDHKIREAASQILNAAKTIRNIVTTYKTPNYLEKLFDELMPPENFEGWKKKVSENLNSLTKEGFMDLFRNHRPIVFVLAIIRPKKECLFSKALKEIDDGIEKRITDKLKTDGYLDKHGRLTRKFHYAHKNTFEITGESPIKSKSIYDKLHAHRFYSKSTVAKLELIQLAQNLQNLNFGFKICEIRRDKKPEPKYESESESESEPEPGPEPKPGRAPKPGPAPKSEPAPKPGRAPKPGPAPKSEPAPKPGPAPKIQNRKPKPTQQKK